MGRLEWSRVLPEMIASSTGASVIKFQKGKGRLESCALPTTLEELGMGGGGLTTYNQPIHPPFLTNNETNQQPTVTHPSHPFTPPPHSTHTHKNADTNSIECAVRGLWTADDLSVVYRRRLLVLDNVPVPCCVHVFEARRIRYSVGGSVSRQPFLVL